METILQILQGLVALLFLMAGGMKVMRSKEEALLQGGDRMAWVEDFSQQQLRIIGVLEALAGIALIIDLLIIRDGSFDVIAGLAAVGLVLTMLGAMFTHYRRKEYPAIGMTLVLLVLSAIVAFAQFSAQGIV